MEPKEYYQDPFQLPDEDQKGLELLIEQLAASAKMNEAAEVPPLKTRTERDAEKTQGGLAEDFAAKYAGMLIYCPSRGWLRFDGRCWVPDEPFVLRKIDKLVKSKFAEAARLRKDAADLAAEASQKGETPPLRVRELLDEAKELQKLGRLNRTARGVRGIEEM
ncbi:MAG: hypothetical protein ACAI44_13880, partial [Candidatus Sericytochromatia bacterium]